MANILNTGSDIMTPVLDLNDPMTAVSAPKSALSKASREFRLPKSSSPTVTRKTGGGNTTKQGVKIPNHRLDNDSDFSTEESSDTEREFPSLKLGSTSFFLKPAPNSSKKARKRSEEQKSDVVLEQTYFGSNSDAYLLNTRTNPSQGSHGDGSPASSTNLKNNKRQNTRNKNKPKVPEGYKAKKKTELCKNWEMNGKWKFGDACAFAHGKQELVSKNHVPSNYKTKMCKQFHEEGYCPYGNRCQFLHLAIQKDMAKFSYSDILKEGLLQYNSRSLILKSDNLEDLMVNSFKTKRLQVFEEFCSENQRKSKKSDNCVNTNTWAKFNNEIVGVEA